MFCVCLFSPLCKNRGQKLVLDVYNIWRKLDIHKIWFQLFDHAAVLWFSSCRKTFAVYSVPSIRWWLCFIHQRTVFSPLFFFHSSHDHSFMSLGRAYPCGKSIQRPAESITALFHPLFNLFSHHPKWGATDVIHRPDHQHQKKLQPKWLENIFLLEI